MKRRLEYIMTAEEHGDVVNIVGSERKNTEMMAKKLVKEDVSKEQIIDFLYGVSTKLEMAENILRDF